MKLSNRASNREDWKRKLSKLVNLRPEEGERTLWMFAFYTLTSVGLLWLEQATTALFLAPFPEGLGAQWLPLIYIASAVMGSGLGFLYSWLQKTLPLPKVLLLVAIAIALPLLGLRWGLSAPTGIVALGSIFTLRLCMDADEILNDLNTQVMANQLFNIREIKRTYPIISSGLLLGDVVAGFSLPLLLWLIGLKNVIIAAAVMMLGGAGVLFYLTRNYRQAFPNAPVLELEGLDVDYSPGGRPLGSLRKYIIPLFAFFVLAEVIYLLVEFQYLKQLEVNLETAQIAGFLGIFGGILGLFELGMQWFVSSRALERLGVFVSAMFLPISLAILGAITLIFDSKLGLTLLQSTQVLFFGIVALRFCDELLRYTLIAGIEPSLFQPLPAQMRNAVQAKVQGIAEPLATGITGVAILGAIALIDLFSNTDDPLIIAQHQGIIFIGCIVVFSFLWAISAWLLRSTYVNLLVQGAEQGRLGFQNSIDPKAFKKATIEALQGKQTEADQRSCIQLLDRIDPQGAAEVLAPRLGEFSPALQQQSLKVMLKYPDPAYRPEIEALIDQKPNLEVLVLALRYVWFSQPNLETRTLKPYLHERVDPVVRGTAASLILRQGTPSEKAEATTTLETMLTSPRERERVVGAQALQEADYAQLTHLYIPELLQDESARVRCALLEVIGKKHLQAYYPALVRGLYYKSTRDSARQALVQLGNEAIPILEKLTRDERKSDFNRLQGWNVLAEIATPEALNLMVEQLSESWGIARRNLLRVLLRVPNELGIEAVLDTLGRGFVENAIDQEWVLLGESYATALDLERAQLSSLEAQLLQSALQDLQADIFERCFLLMRLFYPAGAIQAAALNLRSDSADNVAIGLEILDNVVDISRKQVLLTVLDQVDLTEKIASLETLVTYQPLPPNQRLRHFLQFGHLLSDWLLACGFHLARYHHWSVTQEAILTGLRHPQPYVREAVLSYLEAASPKTCLELLPILKNDPNPIVADQVSQMMRQFQIQELEG